MQLELQNVMAGEDISDCCRKAWKIALLLQVEVRFKFNDQEVYAAPEDDTPNVAANRYYRSLNAAADAAEKKRKRSRG